jgi:hypothetical protein
MRRLANLLCVGFFAACGVRATISNTVPLAFGMTPEVAASALRAPLAYVTGRRGSEVYAAILPAATPGLYRVDGLIYLQFRRNRLTSWKQDWRVAPHPFF